MASEYIRQCIKDIWNVFTNEVRLMFKDPGVRLIIIFASLGYPILYNFVYKNGAVTEMPIAVVDCCNSAESRLFLHQLDATREVSIAYKCISMDDAQRLMSKLKIHGIVYIPKDFSERLAYREQATISTYSDMSSLLYYKCLVMSTSHVMLQEMHDIQMKYYSADNMTEEMAEQQISPVEYDEIIPYNRDFSYTLFFIPAVLMLVIQQTMFYGCSMLSGTMREEKRSFAASKAILRRRGVMRIIVGRGMAYWLVYVMLGVYLAFLVPSMFGIPILGNFWHIFVLLLFTITACVFFVLSCSTIIWKRETVFVLFLFISPILIFLTGFSWPVTAFPIEWKIFSVVFPSTFAVRAYINLASAGATLEMVTPQLIALSIQIVVYACLAYFAVWFEHYLWKGKALAKGIELSEEVAEEISIYDEEDEEDESY